MSKYLAPDSPSSVRARATVSEGWLDAETFEALLTPDTLEGRTLRQSRQSGRILGVWIPEQGRYLYPQWQLSPSREPLPGFTYLLSLLRGSYGVAQSQTTSGWKEVEWLIAPHALLGGATPSKILAEDPDRVLHAVEWADIIDVATAMAVLVPRHEGGCPILHNYVLPS